MPYQVKRDQYGWILNKVGDILVEDVDSKEEFWVPQNNVGFDKQNNVVFRTTSNVNEIYVEAPSENLSESYTESQDSEETDAITNNNNDLIYNAEGTNRNMWSHNATLALITAVEARYEDMHHVTKRKSFWTVITNILESENFIFSDKACQKKWLNLIRTYKATKDNKKKSGRGPARFLYYDRLDEILGDSPTNSSPHSIDVASLQKQSIECQILDSDREEEPLSGRESLINEEKRKRANPRTEYYKAKKIYYDKKQMDLQKHEESQKVFIEESLKLKQIKVDLLKKKLDLEERKVIALEKLVKENQK